MSTSTRKMYRSASSANCMPRIQILALQRCITASAVTISSPTGKINCKMHLLVERGQESRLFPVWRPASTVQIGSICAVIEPAIKLAGSQWHIRCTRMPQLVWPSSTTRDSKMKQRLPAWATLRWWSAACVSTIGPIAFDTINSAGSEQCAWVAGYSYRPYLAVGSLRHRLCLPLSAEASGGRLADDGSIRSLTEVSAMRVILAVLLAAFVSFPVTLTSHEHVVHKQIQEHAHKKRMRQAMRQGTRAPRGSRGGG